MIEFIKAEIKDIPLIQEMAKKSWQSAYAEILSVSQIEYMLAKMYSTEELTKHLNSANFPYYLIKNDEEQVGFIGFEFDYKPETTKLHRIYLLPDFKGKGYGKAGMGFLKKEVKNYGNTRIILNVNKVNNARKIYEAQGFKVYDEGVFDIGKGYVMDDYLMEFLL